jgi:hypothetical protein
MSLLPVLARYLAQEYHCSYEMEYTFHPKRRWRFDLAFPERKIAAEIDGGAWIQGRHTRGRGFIGDQEKINEAQLLGWQVYRFVPDDLENGKFADVLGKALTKT